MNPTDRLLSIVLALQARRWQRAEDLAEMLEVSKRTVYRDVQELHGLGVPVVAVRGKGYRLPDGYVLPPVMLTTDEGTALLLACDHAEPQLEASHRAAVRLAARKLTAALPDALRDATALLRAGARATPANVFDNPGEQERLRLLRRAAVAQCPVRFRRHARNGEAHRTVDPYGLVHRREAWYLVGYDHAAGGVAHFRLDGLDDLDVLDGRFERPAGYRVKPEAEAAPEEEVRVLFDAVATPWVLEQRSRFEVAEAEARPEGLLVTLRVRRAAEVIPWVLAWGGHARVLAPDALQRRVAEEVRCMMALYQEHAAVPTLF